MEWFMVSPLVLVVLFFAVVAGVVFITLGQRRIPTQSAKHVRGRRVYLVQSTGYPVNDNFMELLFWLDAFRRASASIGRTVFGASP